jgi:hypothetical protein
MKHQVLQLAPTKMRNLIICNSELWTIKDYFYLADTKSEESLTASTDAIDRFPELPIITQYTFSTFSKKN